MPALSFSGTTSRGPFWELILKAAKTQTCRIPRKNPIKKGDKLKLYWKQRVPADKKPIHLIGFSMCTNVEKRRRYKDFAFDGAFARRDGFRDSLELQEWFGSPLEWGDEEYDVIHFAPPAPLCRKHHPDVVFVPLIGPGKDGKFGQIGWSCPFICPELQDEWKNKVEKDWTLKYGEPWCEQGTVMFENTMEIL